ncbi:MAG TPA: hypothetical protein VEX68_21560, partial [Bryobacteraceae bacterium]|nr:hypothetical protein [Bryobacteraceae bacterium]
REPVPRPERIKEVIQQERIVVQSAIPAPSPEAQPTPRREVVSAPGPRPPMEIRTVTPAPTQSTTAASRSTMVPFAPTIQTLVREIIRPSDSRASLQPQVRPAPNAERPPTSEARAIEAEPSAPTINVVIGRVTVQATMAAPAAKHGNPRPAPLLPLDRYLAQRARR